jgi:hypothetical protein
MRTKSGRKKMRVLFSWGCKAGNALLNHVWMRASQQKMDFLRKVFCYASYLHLICLLLFKIQPANLKIAWKILLKPHGIFSYLPDESLRLCGSMNGNTAAA